jgi:uncharacterized protein YjbJ (UPF0337 family)
MSGLTDKVTGKAKEVAGNLTDNEKLKAEGKMQQAEGEVKDKASSLKDKFTDKSENGK